MASVDKWVPNSRARDGQDDFAANQELRDRRIAHGSFHEWRWVMTHFDGDPEAPARNGLKGGGQA